MIPKTELARRMCVAEHFIQGPRPCGHHSAMAERYWGLTQPAGEKIMQVLAAAALENDQRQRQEART